MQSQAILRRRGFTLVEVIVSVVIVALTAAGIFASFIAAQNYVSRSRGRVSTSNSVRQQIETLKVEVNQTSWGNSPNCDPDLNGLALTNSTVLPLVPLNCPGSSLGWTAWGNVTGTFGQAPFFGKRRYRVTELAPGGARRTEVQINWTEPGT